VSCSHFALSAEVGVVGAREFEPQSCSQIDGGPSQSFASGRNDRESLESGLADASKSQKVFTQFAVDLLHPYFRADSRLLTVSDIAKRLGVCAATVYKLCASGAPTCARAELDLGIR
jgi:hypothetical protein